jgi:SAM-dependent methyltransferase
VPDDNQAKLHAWLTAAEGRYLANLRVQEVTRALRSLSSAYVERRERGSGRRVLGALDTAGKRAAFALYYAPLHFVAVTHVVHALRAADPAPGSILDFGCGTGAAGSAWALAAGSAATVTGIDRHPWAVSETRWTFSQLGIKGVAKQGDISRLNRYAGECVIAAYTLNELPDDTRDDVEQHLCEHARHGGRVLILEPLARSVAPWWPDTAKRIIGMGGRSDEWKLTVEVPPVVGLLGTAAGLNYRELRFQTLFL